MTTTAIYHGLLAQTCQRLASPVFVKELRVASRRRKYYVLRFAYICLLTFVMVQLWYVVVRAGGTDSAVVQASRLGEAGKHIVATIVWFQFITGQILAAVLLSDAISSEIRRRTLDALLVTPLGSLHVVFGKLLGRLVQLILILALGLPLLAVARIFGGVPWDYLLSSFCITMTAAAFAGSLSLLSSVTHRHAYEAILLVGLWYLVVWGILSGLLMSLASAGYINRATATSALFLTSPLNAMVTQTQAMLRPSGATSAVPAWPLHCLVILAGAAMILALCVWRVRKITLVSILARTDRPARWARVRRAGARGNRTQRQQAIRRVRGSPIVWKELCTPASRARGLSLFHVALAIAIVGLVVFTLALGGGPTYIVLLLLTQILQLLFVIQLAVAAGGAVTREKEARAWPILLTTPLTDKQIVEGKAVGAFRRNLPLLATLLALYLLAFLISPQNEAGLIFIVSMDLMGVVLFLLGLGLYLSTRLKTTAGAVVATLCLYFAPKFFCGGGLAPVLFLSAGLPGVASQRGFLAILAITTVPTLVYAAVGLLCLRAATRRVRRDIF